MIFGKFHNHTVRPKNTVPRYFYFEKSLFVPQKLRMKLLEMLKDVNIKHILSFPKVWENFFPLKRLFMGEQTFLRKFMGDYFTWGLMIKSCKEGGKV